jgi:hypothetical protein
VSRDAEKINQYFSGLKGWPPLEDPTGPGGTEIGTSKEPGDGDVGNVTCTVRTFSMVSNPLEFVKFDPDPNLLWVGSILQGRDFANVGSLAEVPVRERAPLRISINVVMGDSSTVVDVPSNAASWQATSDLIERVAALQKTTVPKDFTFLMRETFSFEQAYLDLGMSAKFSGGSMSGRHKRTSTSNGSSLSVSYIDKCFTVSMDNPQTPADFFGADFTFEDLNNQIRLGRIEDGNVPMFVAGITFGHMIYITFNSSAKSDELRTSVQAAFSGVVDVGGDYTDERRKIVTEAQKSISATGANNAEIEALINEGTIGAYLKQEKDVRTAKPISFAFYKMTDNTLARLSERATFTVKECGEYGGRPSEPVEHLSDVIFDALRAYNNHVVAACQNWADPITREIRKEQFRRFHSEAATGFADLQRFVAADSDKAWVRGWATTMLAEIERQISSWQIGYDTNTSDPGTREVHAEARILSSAMRELCQSLIDHVKK